MSNNVVLECAEICKKIGHHVVVKDLSLKLYEGDILGFIGANGAGKTTSIKLMLGLQFFNSGYVKIVGYDINQDFEKAISYVGAIIENPDLYMYMSGYENLKLVANLYQLSDSRLEEVIQIVGLKSKIHEKVRKYSLGMRQRLGIAQAILHKPKVLILDEPMNGLDPEGINEFKKLLVYLAKNEKMAILISSHMLSELENVCNRICILANGIIVKDDTIDAIKNIADTTTYIMEVSCIHLDNVLYCYDVIDSTHIKVVVQKEQLNHIIKALLLNEVSIFEIKKESLSLEEIFLKTTKEIHHVKAN